MMHCNSTPRVTRRDSRRAAAESGFAAAPRI